MTKCEWNNSIQGCHKGGGVKMILRAQRWRGAPRGGSTISTEEAGARVNMLSRVPRIRSGASDSIR